MPFLAGSGASIRQRQKRNRPRGQAAGPSTPSGRAAPTRRRSSSSSSRGQSAGSSTPTGRATPAPRRSSPPPPSPPPRRSRSSGPVQRVSAPPAPPPPPSKKEFLSADEIYQQALRGSRRALKDFLSDIERHRGESKVQFGRTTEQMEEDRERQLERMRDEFAARGIIHSGLYGEERSNFQEDFQEQMEALQQQQASLLQDFIAKERDFKREQGLAKETARAQALQRRAARFDIPFS